MIRSLPGDGGSLDSMTTSTADQTSFAPEHPLVVAFVFSAALPRHKPAGATAAPIPMG
jgi:hypothetical protein